MFEACSSKNANCHGLKFWVEGAKYTTNYEVPICCTLSPWGEGTLFSEWGEGTGERVQHPGLGKVPDNRIYWQLLRGYDDIMVVLQIGSVFAKKK